LKKCQPAISGNGGHNQTFKVACALVHGFHLDDADALAVLKEWNLTCQPPWSDKELEHKVASARKDGNYADLLTEPPGMQTQGFSAPLKKNDKPSLKPKVELFTAHNLLAKEFKELTWAVPGILPEGATVLAGRPKIGKSWLTLGLALSVSYGGKAMGMIDVAPGDVLYLALEDGPRRLQKRLNKVLAKWQTQAPPNLHLATCWPRVSEGGLDLIAEWLVNHPQARLVIIDTLARIRAKRLINANLYEEDYEALALLKDLGDKHGVAVAANHHTRKTPSEDPLDDVSGTLGLTGAADAVLVLKRQRYARDGKLFVTGRDLEERELPLLFDPTFCLWEQTDAKQDWLTPEQRKVLNALHAGGEALTPMQAAPLLKKEYSATKKLMWQMWKDGLLEKTGQGAYWPSPAAQGNPGNPVTQESNLFDE
jgi:hypothetical protein